MIPGAAKSRDELFWLPYPKANRVLINSHNFNPFDPLEVLGCLIWLDASDSSTLYDATSGGNLVAADGSIARWEDKTGNSRHLLQATSGSQPLRKTSIQSSNDVALFDGTDDVMETAGNFPETGDAAFSVFVVSKKLTAAKGTLFGWGFWNQSRRAFGLYDDNSAVCYGYAGLNNYNIGSIPTSDFYLHSYLKSAGAISATSTARRNRVDTATSGHSVNTPDITSNPFTVGEWAHYDVIRYHGYVCEIIVYDSKLSDSNRDLVEAYLSAKWGIA